MEIGPQLPQKKEKDQENLPSKLLSTLKGHEGAALSVKFNIQGTYCISTGKDRSVRLWNPHRGILIKTYQGHGYEVRDACISSDNSKFATGGGDRQIFLWDIGTGRIIRKFRGHESTVNSIEYAANDDILVSGGYDKYINVWDCKARSFNAIQQLQGFKDSVSCVRANESSIIASSIDGSVKRFDIRMGRIYTDVFQEPVTCVKISNDGNCILCACMCNCICLTDKSTGELLANYKGHKHESFKIDCAFTKGDLNVVGASEDGYIYYWELVEANIMKRFQAHKETICALDYCKDNSILLTSSTDGTIKAWC